MAYSTLLYDSRDDVAFITLNRPDSYNAITVELARELADAALRASVDPSVGAVVVRGAGKVFCAGGDLKDFNSRGADMPAYLHEVTTALHTAMSRFARMAAPVIAAVHGSAAGGGMSLALGCDLIVAAESSAFTMAYTRIGLTPDGSSSYYLPRVVGLKRAVELVLTNRMLGAQEALEWGIVAEVVPDDELEGTVEDLARTLASGPTGAFGWARRLLYDSGTESLETQMALETQTIAQVAETADAREGIGAFLEKRRPVYRRE